MPYKTISVNMEAYEALRKEKREGESFSDVILRLTKKPNLEKFIALLGVLKDELTEKDVEEFIKTSKEAWQDGIHGNT